MLMRIAAYFLGSLGISMTLPVFAAAPFAFNTAPGRLPKDVVPLDYSISLAPDVDGLTVTGTESVTLRFRKATASVVFNSLNQTLSEVRLDGQPVRSVR